jgi:hypothetical protein
MHREEAEGRHSEKWQSVSQENGTQQKCNLVAPKLRKLISAF